VRDAGGARPVSWKDALAAAGTALTGARRDGVRFLLSAHASHEEMFVTARFAQELLGAAAHDAITIGWTTSAKAQPANTKFRVPDVDAPNVAGARALDLVRADARTADPSALKAEVDAGRVSALYVLDPGPAGSVGDTSWVVAARTAGTLPVLIVQAPVKSDLAAAADVVLPGSAWVEKHAAYTNATGQLQSTAKAIIPPGEARDDWQIVVDVALAAGVALGYGSLPDVRQAIVALLPDEPVFKGLAELEYRRAVRARHWLESSNPSERVKWDTMFLDLPPFKFERMFEPGARADVIPLTPVE
jgi:predicted molibdopterin-dependent oxidoreductase YjgC